jgi:hypothetical protein
LAQRRRDVFIASFSGCLAALANSRSDCTAAVANGRPLILNGVDYGPSIPVKVEPPQTK